MLQWAHANDCPWDEDTCIRAAGGGHLEVLQLAHANGFSWDEQICEMAEEAGHDRILEWAKANGAPKPPRVSSIVISRDERNRKRVEGINPKNTWRHYNPPAKLRDRPVQTTIHMLSSAQYNTSSDTTPVLLKNST